MTLAAGLIVVLNWGFINGLSLDVSIGPLVQLMPVEGDALLANREFPDMGPDGLVELGPTHAQVTGGVAGTDKPG